jgi:hypothetical protein
MKTGYLIGLVALLFIFSFVFGRYLTMKDATVELHRLCERGAAFQIEGSDDIYTCYNVTKLENQE